MSIETTSSPAPEAGVTQTLPQPAQGGLRQVAVRSRISEIDLVRGIAFVAMVIYHFSWDLTSYGVANLHLESPGMVWFQRSIAGTFTTVAGISLVLSYQAAQRKGFPYWQLALRRGTLTFGCGVLVSLATFFGVGDAWVRYGILHMIGTAILLSPLFLPLGRWNALIGLVLVLGAPYLQQIDIGIPWLSYPLGMPPTTLPAVDYFSLVPWLGMILIGIAIGNVIFAEGQTVSFAGAVPEGLRRPLVWAGRHSLTLYLIHQPILLVITLLLYLSQGHRLF